MLQIISLFSLVVSLILVADLVVAAEYYNRADFPANFVFGSSTSAYQYEGAALEDGRTPAIWDTFAHSGRTDGANGDVACNGYHKYKEDVKLMSNTGLEAFRFSISWSRLIPNGRGPVNPKGLQYYNNFINELIRRGIQPHVTLHHFDLPQALEDEYGGWLSRKIVQDFTAYAEVCFREFGDRVLSWTTVNEANVFSLGGYNQGTQPPGRCSPPIKSGCVGNSSTEPYIVVHNILLSHSSVWRLYSTMYKASQKGYVGVNIFAYALVPHTDSKEDEIATQRANDFFIGWLIDPLVYGNYPEIIRKKAQGRIPVLTKYESEQIKGSFDFIGLNHYRTVFVKDDSSFRDIDKWDFIADMAVKFIYERSDTPDQFVVSPSGLYMVLEYLKRVYGNPPVYVHENGQCTRRNGTLDDTPRIEYIHAYIGSLLDAIRNGSNTKGYFTWTFLDCLELLDGYETAFGFYYVDLDDPEMKRYEKLSAHWYADFLKGKNIAPGEVHEQRENMFVSLKSPLFSQ